MKSIVNQYPKLQNLGETSPQKSLNIIKNHGYEISLVDYIKRFVPKLKKNSKNKIIYTV